MGVGGTALLVKAQVHRAGAIFTWTPYKHALETEGFGRMANDMGYQVIGLPNYVILHS